MECLVKAGCYQNDSVLYFCFCLCVMRKCLSNDDRYGDEKEMLNWRKNIFEILLPSFVLFSKSLLICKKKKKEITDNESGRQPSFICCLAFFSRFS